MFRALASAAVAVMWVTATGAATVVSVAATSKPWLAGMPAGTVDPLGDAVPAQSPVLVMGVTPGASLLFAASGLTDHCGGGGCGLAGPEGDALEGSVSHSGGAQYGIASLTAPIDALIGVFLDDTQPDLAGPAPAALDFSILSARDFSILNAELRQPFFIGDGMRNDGSTMQAFVVPAGATRLFLGTMDGSEWANNVGSLTVTVSGVRAPGVPEPATLLLGALAAAAALGAGRRRRGR